MMKRILLATVAMTALSTVGALAADLPARMPYKAAPMPVGYNWTGAYMGVNIGGAFGSFDLGGGSSNMTGVTGGGQIGYNWQAAGSPWVWGLEADFNGSSQNRDFAVGPTTTASESLPFFGTVRGRLGFAWDRAMIYATGGLAYQNVKLSITDPAFSGSVSDTKTGYAVGGGVEWALWDRWTARVEYLYLDTGDTSVTTTGGNFGGRVTNNIVRTGLNYRF
jgi:outer membrane immunogenic protein